MPRFIVDQEPTLNDVLEAAQPSQPRFIIDTPSTTEKAQTKPNNFQGLTKGRAILDQGLQGATFGFADEPMDFLGATYAKYAPTAIGGRPDLFEDKQLADVYNDTRDMSKQRLSYEMNRAPGLYIASNLGGGLLTGSAIGSTALGQAASNSLKSGPLWARMGKGALSGAATGGLFGAGSADDGKRLEGAKSGAVTGGIVGGILPAAGAILTGAKKEIQSLLPKSAESAAGLRKAASPLYDNFTKSGGVYSSKLTDEIADIADAAKSTGIAGQQKPADEALNNALDFYSSLRGKKLNPADLQKLDQSFTDDVARFNRAGEYNFGRILNDLKYEMRSRAFDPKNAANYVESGNPSAVQDLLDANKLWSQSYKAKDVEKILQRAQGTENPQTSIRTGIKNLLANDKKMISYSDKDRAILEDAMKRGYVGGLVKLLGGRLTDSVAGGVAGLAAGGPAGAVGGAIAGKGVGGIMANAAGGIQANRLRGGLQNIQNGSQNIQASRPITTGIIPAMGAGEISDLYNRLKQMGAQ